MIFGPAKLSLRGYRRAKRGPAPKIKRLWHFLVRAAENGGAEATERIARLSESEARLRVAERSAAFLLTISDRSRAVDDQQEILVATAEALGRHLGATGVTFGEANGDEAWVTVLHQWRDGAPPISGRYPLSVIGDTALADFKAGRTLRIDDVEKDARIAASDLQFYASVGIAALVGVPLVRGGQLAGYLSTQQSEPRVWTDAEVRLIESAADRTWASVERSRAEAALREREAQLAAFMEHAPASMYMKDEAGRFLLANDDLAHRLGVPGEVLIGRKLSEVARREIAEVSETQEREVLQTGRAITSDQSYEVAGSIVHALATRFPVPDAEGKLTRVGGMLLDMTEQKRAEADLERARERLYQSEKLSALGSLLAGVAHELNNPLAIISGEALMLEEDAAGTPLAPSAAAIREAAERCSKIVATFLAMARQKPARRVSTNLNEVAHAALDLAAYNLRSAGVTVTREFAPDLPDVAGDPDQLHQVVLNLLINAQQALEAEPQPRQIVVRTSCDQQAASVVVEVSDNGAGIPEELRRRIWEPYFTTKPQGSGTGIGLAFSRGIAEAHGGTLSLAQGEPGATFQLKLPFEIATSAPPSICRPTTKAGSGTVLVVDDEPELARTLSRLIERLGWSADVAAGGAAAKERLLAREYDAILCDVRMPDVDGPSLLAWIAVEQPHLRSRFAFVTGDTLGPSAARLLADTDCPFIEKPFSPDSVADLLAGLGGRG